MKLILINGPCGVGKSTVAKQLWDLYEVADTPMVLVGIDELRRMVGLRQTYPKIASKLALKFAAGMIECGLADGRDVIVEKMLYNVPEHGDIGNTVDVYRAIGEKYNAEIYEIILWADKNIVLVRADERGYPPNSNFTREKVEIFWHELDKFKDTRSDAHIIDTANLSLEETFQKVRKVVGL